MTRVEDLLLNRNATEASFKYIENLILDRVKGGSLLSSSECDTSEDLLDLLEGCLHRAGVGWVMVVADRISKDVVHGSLAQIASFDVPTYRVIDSLSRLLFSFPVLVVCNYENILRQSLRLVQLSAHNPSVAVTRLICAVVGARKPSNSDLHSICTSSLYHLSIVNDSITAEGLLELLNNCTEYLSRDVQMVNTCIGLCGVLLSKFPENREIRRHAQQFRSSLSVIRDSSELVVDAEQEEETINHKLDITNENDAVDEAGEVVDDDMMSSSPKSSCPSLLD